MSQKIGLKGRLARMFLNFLDEHGDYRTQLEEAAARAAAASASSLLAKDREGRKKKRKRGRFGLGGGDDDDDEEVEMIEQPLKNQLPDDPYEQIQFYIRTFRQRTYEQFTEQVELTKVQIMEWVHNEIHHVVRVPLTSSGLFLLCGALLGWRRRSQKFCKIQRVHGIMGKKFDAKLYLHGNFVRGRMLGECTTTGKEELEKLEAKAAKAEEAALASMRPYQRKKYERLTKMQVVGEYVVVAFLVMGMVAGACCAAICAGRYFWGGGDVIGDGANNQTEQLDGYIYSLDGPVDDDGYPLGIQDAAEAKYGECLTEAELAGVQDPTTVCNVTEFFEAAAHEQRILQEEQKAPLSFLREKVLEILNRTTPLPSALNNYMVHLPTSTILYLASILSFTLYLLTQTISSKISTAASANDPMKHFVATATDSTVKADGTVVAKRGETEAQRKRRERMMQQEKMKAQMAQLAMEAKQRVAERRKRLEGEEAAKKEEEEREVKVKEEMNETVKMYSRQFMMLKAGVPDGAILNTFLAEGVEEEEGKEILVKLKEIKEKRAEEARKQEEEEEARQKKEADEEKEKERIAAERLRLMKQGSFSGGSALKPPLSKTLSQPCLVRKGTTGSSVSNKTDSNLKSAKSSMRSSLPANSSLAIKITSAAADSSNNSTDGASLPTTSSVATANSSLTATSSKKQAVDPSIAKGKMLGDIGKVSLGSLRQTKPPAKVDVKAKVRGLAPEESISNGGSTGVSSPLRTKETLDKDIIHPLASTTPQKSNVTQEDKENKSSFTPIVAKQVSELTSSDEVINLDDSPTPPLLTRVSSPTVDTLETFPVQSNPARGLSPSVDNTSVNSSSDQMNPMDLLEAPSGWGHRLTAADIQAQIEAAELEDEEDDDEDESIEHQPEDLNLGPNAFHSPGFDLALRNSNASWDRRPSSRDIMARIKEAEELEAKHTEIEEDMKRAEMIRSRSARNSGAEVLPIIGENQEEQKNDVEVRRRTRAGDDDSEVSELSMTTHEENALDLSKGRNMPPKALFLRQDPGKVPISPALTASPLSGFHSKSLFNEKAQEAIHMAEKGEIALPPMPVIVDECSSTVKSETKEETEEEKQRRERAEKRAKKMEEMAARRNAGEEDASSVVSGLSKLRRRRKKKVKDDPSEDLEAAPVKEVETEDTSAVEKEETEEEKQKRLRAEKRAKKMEEMAAKRNAGQDDGSIVSGISKHHRIRRKKSALAAINPEEKAKSDWCNSIFSYVLNAEQSQWQRTIYGHVLNAQQTRESNVAMKKSIEEADKQARRIIANQKSLESRAKKIAAKSDRIHKLRLGGASNDEESNMSKSLMRRRRNRKSSSKPLAVQVEEPTDDKKSASAIRLQSLARKVIYLKRYQKSCTSILSIQCFARQVSAKLIANEVRCQQKSSILIQTAWRRHSSTKVLTSAKLIGIWTQSHYRGCVVRAMVIKLSSAIRIQSIVRRSVSLKSYQKSRACILSIQCCIRRVAAKLLAQKKRRQHNSILIQKAWRRHRSIETFNSAKNIGIWAQAHHRGNVGRAKFNHIKQERASKQESTPAQAQCTTATTIANESDTKLESEALAAQQALEDAKKEKEKQAERRARKMNKIQKSRMESNSFDADEISVATEGSSSIRKMRNKIATAGGSSMRLMRDRRKKAAKKASQT